ncbi:MAG: response regulator transcription factor [Desulfurivibrionaceae bacterium]|jgi:two-component system response regulator NreC
MSDKLKVLVADDHAIVREGMCQLLMDHPAMDLVGQAVDGRDVVDKAKQLKPQVILLDIAMPGLNGLEALTLLREVAPETRVVILSMYDKEAYVHRALCAGARGYVLKTDSGREVIDAILKVDAGQYYLSAKLNAEVIRKYLNPEAEKKSATSGYDRLTEREQQIFRLTVEGHPTKGIAQMLYLSPRTVEKHRSNIVKKLDIHDPMAMVRYAVKIGVVDPELWT